MVQAGGSLFAVCEQVSSPVGLKEGNNVGAKGDWMGSLHHEHGQLGQDELQADDTWAQGVGKGSLVWRATDYERQDVEDEVRRQEHDDAVSRGEAYCTVDGMEELAERKKE